MSLPWISALFSRHILIRSYHREIYGSLAVYTRVPWRKHVSAGRRFSHPKSACGVVSDPIWLVTKIINKATIANVEIALVMALVGTGGTLSFLGGEPCGVVWYPEGLLLAVPNKSVCSLTGDGCILDISSQSSMNRICQDSRRFWISRRISSYAGRIRGQSEVMLNKEWKTIPTDSILT